MGCNHDETSHGWDLTQGCVECDCIGFVDEDYEPSEAELDRMNDPEGGGHNDSDPTYRRAMQDAGRGHLLR